MIKKIAILEGDGIGPEIMKEAMKVLHTIEEKYGHQFEKEYAPFGAGAYFTEGHPFPDKTKKICDEADAILKGPVGLAVTEMNKIPQDKRPEKEAILPLRARYSTYANYRPVRLPAELAHFSPLKKEVIANGIDIMMIRELVGGIYFGKKTEGTETKMEYSIDECLYDRKQIEQIAHIAFQEAQRKNKIMTNVHKANVLATSRFWNAVVEEVAKKYPDVKYQSVLVDNAAYQLVVNPAQFNGVMLMSNMQGDILTDQAGGVIGSLGLMPSACMGKEKGYVEPAHGSAPDIAGKNIANPYSMIGSVAFMLDKCFNLRDEADLVWNGMFQIFEKGYVTAELSGPATDKSKILSTTQFGDMVKDYILEK